METISPAECDIRAGDLLQTGFWGAFKSDFGWKPHHVSWNGEAILVLQRKLAGPTSFLYVPRGPSLASVPEPGRTASLADLARELKTLSAGSVFARFDPPWSTVETIDPGDEKPASANDVPRPSLGAPFRRASMDIQPPDTVIVDLAEGDGVRSDENLLATMKPKWRYNIRLASKKGVSVSDEGIDAMDVFYELYLATSRRDRIAVHPKSYYLRLLSLAREYGPGAPDLRLWIARHEGRPIAAIITSFKNGQAVYLYGASGGEKRNLMPAYALQWEAMRAARDCGCTSYDMYGIPPRADPSHPMSGLYRFKTGFGGRIAHFAGSWDYPFHTLPYAAYRVAESARKYWFKRWMKRGGRANAG
ncbi:MAG: peptidoglycan bridge formation glycyltransferase FemA/FemB family protein [Spirochaetes bacterium]|nr:peptidoglycan bridge formation glycyltransferase FemA/FemB family protein [Spirochaetota bacterium]